MAELNEAITTLQAKKAVAREEAHLVALADVTESILKLSAGNERLVDQRARDLKKLRKTQTTLDSYENLGEQLKKSLFGPLEGLMKVIPEPLRILSKMAIKPVVKYFAARKAKKIRKKMTGFGPDGTPTDEAVEAEDGKGREAAAKSGFHQKKMAGIPTKLDELINVTKSLGKKTAGFFKSLFSFLKLALLLNLVTKVFSGTANFVMGGVAAAASAASAVIGAIAMAMWTKVKDLFIKAIKGVKNLVMRAGAAVGAAAKGAWSWARELGTMIRTAWVQAWKLAGEGIKAVGTIVGNWATRIGNMVTAAWEKGLELVKGMIRTVKLDVTKWASSFKLWVVEIWTHMSGKITALIRDVPLKIAGWGDRFGTWVVNIWGKITSRIGILVDDIVTHGAQFATKAWTGPVKTFAGNIWRAVTGSLVKIVSAVVVAGGLTALIRGLFTGKGKTLGTAAKGGLLARGARFVGGLFTIPSLLVAGSIGLIWGAVEEFKAGGGIREILANAIGRAAEFITFGILNRADIRAALLEDSRRHASITGATAAMQRKIKAERTAKTNVLLDDFMAEGTIAEVLKRITADASKKMFDTKQIDLFQKMRSGFGSGGFQKWLRKTEGKEWMSGGKGGKRTAAEHRAMFKQWFFEVITGGTMQGMKGMFLQRGERARDLNISDKSMLQKRYNKLWEESNTLAENAGKIFKNLMRGPEGSEERKKWELERDSSAAMLNGGSIFTHDIHVERKLDQIFGLSDANGRSRLFNTLGGGDSSMLINQPVNNATAQTTNISVMSAMTLANIHSRA